MPREKTWLNWVYQNQGIPIPAGNRSRCPINLASGGTNFMKYYGMSIYAPADTAVANISAVWDNGYFIPNGNLVSANLPDYALRAGLEYPIGGTTIIPMVSENGGLLNPVVQASTRTRMKAPSKLIIPAGARYRIRWDMQYLNTGGGTFNIVTNTLLAPGRNDHATSGIDPSVIKCYGGVTYPDFATVTQVPGPTIIQCDPVKTLKKFVLVVGNSIDRSSNDTVGTTQQGDWLTAVSPSADYPNYGNAAWPERSIGISYPYYNISIPGQAVNPSGFNLVNYRSRYSALKGAMPAVVILPLGVNDLIVGTSADTVLRYINTAIRNIRVEFPYVPIWITTITPVTSSSDGYTTEANQGFSGSVEGASITWANFNDASGNTGRLWLNNQIKAGATLADAVLDVAAVCQGVDPRKWRVDLGVFTAGIHPIALGHITIANAIGLTARINAL